MPATNKEILRKWLPLAVVAVVATAIALPPMLTFASTTQHVIDTWLELYTTNPFGWTLTYVKTTAHAVFSGPYTFDTFASYTQHNAWTAWWCISCYANINTISKAVTSNVVGEEDAWSMGSWNVRYTGTINVWVKIVGQYLVEDKIYKNVNGVQNLVLDDLIKVTKFIVEHLKDIVSVINSGGEEGHAPAFTAATA